MSSPRPANVRGTLLTFDDQGYLFEAVGLVIGTTAVEGHKPEQRQQYVRHVLAPLWAPLRDPEFALKAKSDVMGYADWTCRLLMVSERVC